MTTMNSQATRIMRSLLLVASFACSVEALSHAEYPLGLRGVLSASYHHRNLPKKTKGKLKGAKILEYEDFEMSCQVHLTAEAHDGLLSQDDYAGFLEDYCKHTENEGPLCPGEEEKLAFEDLPEELQLVFATSACPFKDQEAKKNCLTTLLEEEEQFGYNEEIEELCLATLSIIQSSSTILDFDSSYPSMEPSLSPVVEPASEPAPSATVVESEEEPQEAKVGSPSSETTTNKDSSDEEEKSLVLPLTLAFGAIAFFVFLGVAYFVRRKSPNCIEKLFLRDPQCASDRSETSHSNSNGDVDTGSVGGNRSDAKAEEQESALADKQRLESVPSDVTEPHSNAITTHASTVSILDVSPVHQESEYGSEQSERQHSQSSLDPSEDPSAGEEVPDSEEREE